MMTVYKKNDDHVAVDDDDNDHDDSDDERERVGSIDDIFSKREIFAEFMCETMK